MSRKPYITRKHIICEIIGGALSLLNLAFVLVMILLKNINMLEQIQSDNGKFALGSPASLMVIAVILVLANASNIQTNHGFTIFHYRIPFRVNPDKKDIVMYYMSLCTCINMVEMGIWVCIMSPIWLFDLEILYVPMMVLLFIVLIPTTLIFTALAYRHNK